MSARQLLLTDRKGRPPLSSPRKSAAMVLTRGSGDSAEVYLALRSPRLRFFGGFHAFPGGVIDPDEIDLEGGGASAFARCAVRELFEEVGVWIGPGAPPDRERLRRGLISADDSERDHAASLWRGYRGSSEPQLETVLEITTPPFAPRRYETEFFHVVLPEGESPEIWEGELVGGEFVRPSVALSRWRSGEILIAPPVLLLLEFLSEYGVEGFAAVARAEGEALRGGKLHPVRFSPGIFVAPLEAKTKPPATTTNCFLVGVERVYVVDPAPSETAEQQRLFAKLDRVGEEGASIEGVLVTHSHPDHVGAVASTARRYGVGVSGHRLALAALALSGVESTPIADGDELDLGIAPDGSVDWRLRVLATPGHAPDHLAFIESRYGAMIVGDLLSSVSTVLIDPPEGHLRTYLETLDRLLQEPDAMVYPSHGPAVPTGHAMIRHFIRHRTERVDQIERAIASGVGSEEHLLEQIYGETPRAAWPLARRSLAASLEFLADAGRASRGIEGEWSTE